MSLSHYQNTLTIQSKYTLTHQFSIGMYLPYWPNNNKLPAFWAKGKSLNVPTKSHFHYTKQQCSLQQRLLSRLHSVLLFAFSTKTSKTRRVDNTIFKGVLTSHFLKGRHMNCRQACPAPRRAQGETPVRAGKPQGTRWSWHLCKENPTKGGRKFPAKNFVETGPRFK